MTLERELVIAVKPCPNCFTCKRCREPERKIRVAKFGPCKGIGGPSKGCPCGFCKTQPINHQPKG